MKKRKWVLLGCFIWVFLSFFGSKHLFAEEFSSLGKSGQIKIRIAELDSSNNQNSNDNNSEEIEEDPIFPDFKINYPERVLAGEEFEVSVSSEATLSDFNYEWDKDKHDFEKGEGDGEQSFEIDYEGEKAIFRYIKPGGYEAVLRIKNQKGQELLKEFQIDVANPILSDQIKISAVYPNPPGADNALRPGGEVFWLINQSETFVDLAGWVVYDDDNTHEILINSENGEFKEGTLIGPGEEVRIFRNGDSDFSLNNEGDALRLFDFPIEMEGVLRDQISYPTSKEGKIYVRNFENDVFEEKNEPASPILSLLKSNIAQFDFFETKEVKAFVDHSLELVNFSDFSLEKLFLSKSEKAEKSFVLKNLKKEETKVFARATLAENQSNLFDENLKEYVVLKFKNESIPLQDLFSQPKEIFLTGTVEEEEIILEIEPKEDLPPNLFGREIVFNLELFEVAKEGSEENQNKNENSESPLPESESGGEVENKNPVLPAVFETVSVEEKVQNENQEIAKKDSKKKKNKKEKKKEKKNEKPLSTNISMETSVIKETPKEEPQKTNNPLLKEDEEKKIILSAKEKEVKKSFWSFFDEMGFLTKMFLFWFSLWSCLFFWFWKRKEDHRGR